MASVSKRGVAALVVLASIWCSAEAAGTPTLLAPIINVAASTVKEGASGALVVIVDGVKASQSSVGTQEGVLADPNDLEKAAENPPIVTFEQKVLPLPASGTQRRWVLPFKVFAMPAGKTLTRYVSFKVDDVEWALAYQLVSPAAVSTTWSLKPVSASARSLMKDDKEIGLPIVVSVTGNLPVTGLTVAADPLEKDLKRSLSKGGWKLCEEQSASTCREPLTLSGAGMHKLWMMPVQPAELEEGKYDAVVTVASADKPAGESISLAVNVSSTGRQLAGFAAIAAGSLLAIYVTVFLRVGVQREEMLESAVRLREVYSRLVAALNLADTQNVASAIRNKLQTVHNDLSDLALEANGLPKRFSPPGTRTNDPVKLDQFKKHIETQAAWLDALDVLIRTGVVALVDAWKAAGSDPGKVTDLDNAIVVVDGPAAQPAAPVASSLLPLTAQQVAAFTALVRGAPLGGNGAPGQPRTLQELRLRVSRTSFVAWAILLVITVLVGAHSQILLNPGFGTTLDLVACFLWGIGLPTGAALAGATTSTVATTLNVVRVQ